MEKIKVKKTASRGVSVAPVYCYQEPDLTPEERVIREDEVDEETGKFEAAREAVAAELAELAEKNAIFAAHREIARDFVLQERVWEKIREGKNAQAALDEAIREFAAVFDGMDDAYMKERAADVRDVGKRLAANLKGVRLPDLGGMERESIVAARDLYPSDTVKLDPALVRGILTEEGGVTSHVSIMAKSMNIPTLVGVEGLLNRVENGDLVCMDAGEGTIVLRPDEETKHAYLRRQADCEEARGALAQLRCRPAVTRKGRRVLLCANVGSAEELRRALPMGIDGVGLFRSEFLYMENTHFPTEEEQFRAYSEAARLCPGELTIRTLDIGGDKELPYFKFEKEENPFLGWRAIRISLELKGMFKEQLRAILRAGASGRVRILLPMIISMEELRETKAIIRECKEELCAEGVAFEEEMKLGIMIETPASVLLADEFAKEADFFSIGTNDLTQYLLAVDRGNRRLSDRYDFLHPAVLRAVRHVIDAGHREGIQVGMCGEMAASPAAVPLLLDMGLDEFSMSAGSLDEVRRLILEYEG